MWSWALENGEQNFVEAPDFRTFMLRVGAMGALKGEHKQAYDQPSF